MKISKTRVGIAVATVALAVGCVAGAGCAAQQPGHYVNNDPSTFELDPIRNECRSCHSVDPNKKLGDDATYEEAEVETGQEGLDD